jgi:hypothetical protein
MSATTVPTVKAKLAELFKLVLGEPTEVWSPRPNEEHQLAENVYIGDVRGSRKFVTFSAGSPGSREETYEIQIDVEVYREGTDGLGAEARMWEIVEALEVPLAQKPSIEGLGGQWALAGRFDQSTTAGNDGFLAKYTLGVEVTARI